MSDQSTQAAYRLLAPGDRAPSFKARTRSNPQFTFDSVGGRWIVLAFPGTVAHPQTAQSLATAYAATDVFDDDKACLFTVINAPEDEAQTRIGDMIPGRRVFWDTDLAVARLFGALPAQADADAPLRPFWMVIDPSLTVRKVIPMTPEGTCVDEVLDYLRAAPPAATFMGFEMPAPVLVLPDVFEPDFCDHLIRLYHDHGGQSSGFMRDQGGKTVAVMDPSFKVRNDFTLTDPELIAQTQNRILRKVVPQIERIHYFKCTRMERYMVGCYPADEGGHFRPHRDNTTMGTAHRRFAVSINLNDDFEGGAVSFPEFNPRGIKAPKGTAVIFSCSLLHAVSKVTSGTRYAFLPFLYDDAAAAIRERNAANVPNAAGYKA